MLPAYKDDSQDPALIAITGLGAVAKNQQEIAISSRIPLCQ